MVYYFWGDKVNEESVELHGFSDASCFTYAAVVYLRSGTQPSTVSLVASKPKLHFFLLKSFQVVNFLEL